VTSHVPYSVYLSVSVLDNTGKLRKNGRTDQDTVPDNNYLAESVYGLVGRLLALPTLILV